MARRLLALSALALLAACGQKGPLYLPDRRPQPVPAAPAPTAAPAQAPDARQATGNDDEPRKSTH